MNDSKLKELSRESFAAGTAPATSAASASTSSIKTCEEYVINQLAKASSVNNELLALCINQKERIQKHLEILNGLYVDLSFSGEYWVIKWNMVPGAEFNIVTSDGLVLTKSYGDQMFKKALDHLGLKLPELPIKESSDEDEQGSSEAL